MAVSRLKQFLRLGRRDRGEADEQAKEETQMRQEPVVPSVKPEELREPILTALRTVFDPEIPVNIYDLGLIYGIEIADDGDVDIDMTLTAPACPVAGTLPGTVEDAVRQVEGVGQVRVELVWDPPWTKDKMSDEALLQLGMM